MLKNSYASYVRFLIIPMIMVCSLLVTPYAFSQETPSPTTQDTPPATEVKLPSKDALLTIQPDDLIIGTPKAPVTIIEYASLSCSHCADFYNHTFEELKKKYIETDKAVLVYRDFPLNEPAMRASMVVACAPEASKEKFLKVLFSTQNNWAFRKNYLEVLSNIAKLGGMPQETFEQCIQNSDLEHRIAESRFFAAKVLEVRATPTFYINGVEHSGAKTIDYLSAEIDKLLE